MHGDGSKLWSPWSQPPKNRWDFVGAIDPFYRHDSSDDKIPFINGISTEKIPKITRDEFLLGFPRIWGYPPFFSILVLDGDFHNGNHPAIGVLLF